MTIPTWWLDAVVYQIYPRSFADANGDGIGDLPGVVAKLDYLQWLGITAIWFSPFYPSPQFDVGYDIADYTDIAPEYGTLTDFDRLRAEAHRRGIRIILDLVLNHTSHQHKWFIESKSSRVNPKRDWYIWRDGQGHNPPNDWESTFGGPAWEYDPITGQYYYHFFYVEQPDLNWRNPAVQEAMYNVVRFWLDRGVDGFRLDAIGTLFEVEDLRDANAGVTMDELMTNIFTRRYDSEIGKLFARKVRYQVDLPEVKTILQQLRRVNDECTERILLGETEDIRYYGDGSDMLHSVFNFDLTKLEQLDPAAIRKLLNKRWSRLPAGVWEANTVGNHDRPRSMTVYADGRHDREREQAALAMTLFLRGAPVFYNGEEIGMRNIQLTDIAAFRDQIGLWAYGEAQKHGFTPEQALAIANQVSRDKGRSPMQWENAPNGGFSPAGIQPWLPVHPNYADGVNVADQRQDETSLLHTFRRMIQTRQEHIALRRGELEWIPAKQSGKALAFWRKHADETCFVALNMSAQTTTVKAPGAEKLRLVFSTHEPQVSPGQIVLPPYAVVVAVKE